MILNHAFVKLKSKTSKNRIGHVRASDRRMSPSRVRIALPFQSQLNVALCIRFKKAPSAPLYIGVATD